LLLFCCYVALPDLPSFPTRRSSDLALLTLGVLVLGAYTFALLGLLSGLWAEKFEQVNFFPTFVMLPLTFLGGVFYNVEQLPGIWRTVSLFNPVVYLVDGLRYGMLGVGMFQPWVAPTV